MALSNLALSITVLITPLCVTVSRASVCASGYSKAVRITAFKSVFFIVLIVRCICRACQLNRMGLSCQTFAIKHRLKRCMKKYLQPPPGHVHTLMRATPVSAPPAPIVKKIKPPPSPAVVAKPPTQVSAPRVTAPGKIARAVVAPPALVVLSKKPSAFHWDEFYMQFRPVAAPLRKKGDENKRLLHE